ncbi:hypothetical protein Q1M63_24515 [Sinorhizobium meliloti]|nr:hypothetical protein LZK74_23010 [Sinorhizobium meliloti]WKL27185.1 hypothetical protein Q1M63_24515 [Sinorhizobium meliloti]WKL32651.1 hypothetical protein Q1M65_22145 [Sinorhizobium meliloti]WKL38417.1 hypothetical protein Q1M62_21735 [Sinorhizobium meliloti]
MNSQIIEDSQQELNNSSDDLSVTLMAEIEEQLAIEAALSDFDASGDPGFKERRLKLMRDTSDRLHNDALRNGKKAQAHKRKQRADYAQVILETEGRPVRPYEKASPERRKAQRKASKANRSPEQIAREREADKLRRREKRKAEAERQHQAMLDRAIF